MNYLAAKSTQKAKNEGSKMEKETIKFELKPYHGHVITGTKGNTTATVVEMGRVFTDLPIDEAEKLQNYLNNLKVARLQ